MRERTLSKKEQHKRAAIVGSFVVLTIVFLLFSVMWIKNFSLRPAYSFFVRFKEPPYITMGSPAYFRGVKVGKIGAVELSPDNRSVYVRIDIRDKELKLPVNTRISIHTEGITGVIYFILAYPSDTVPSSIAIEDGMVVQGVEPFNWEKVQRYITKMADEGQLDKLLTNAQDILGESKAFMTDTRKAAQSTTRFMDQATRTAASSELAIADIRALAHRASHTIDKNDPLIHDTLIGFRKSATGLNKLLGTSNNFLSSANGQSFGSTLQDVSVSVKNAMDNWGAASNQMNQTFSYVQGELKQTGIIQKVSDGASKVNAVGTQAEHLLVGINQTPGGKSSLIKLGGTIQSTASQIQQATQRFDCVQTGVAQILNQRFALLKLMFGRPGKSLDACVAPTGPLIQTVSEKPGQSLTTPIQNTPLQLQPQPTQPFCLPTQAEPFPKSESYLAPATEPSSPVTQPVLP